MADAPMKDVEGKVAFITGGSSGIGLGIARALADAGMQIVLTYQTEAHLDSALKYLMQATDHVHAIKVDVSDRAGMEAAAAETVMLCGKVHVLVNNAGVAAIKPVAEITYDDWDWLIATNLTGVFNGIHAFLPHIRTHGDGGQIITTSSVMGLATIAGHGLYSASKFALVGLTEALRLELRDENIGASVFCPGYVWANLASSHRNRSSDPLAPPVAEIEKRIAEKRNVEGAWAMDALEAGQLFLQGMRRNDLYILTHGEFESLIRVRNEAVMASMPTGRPVPSARRERVAEKCTNPVYAAELAKHRSAARRS